MSSFLLRRYVLLALALCLLTVTSCQRAVYLFQPVSAHSLPAPALASLLPAADTGTVQPPPASRGRHQRRASLPTQRHGRQFRLPLVSLQQALAAGQKREKAPLAVRQGVPRAHRSSHNPARPAAAEQPVQYRSKFIALLLAVLGISYLPLSLHNFYLGYPGRGLAAIGLVIVGTLLLVAGIPFFPFTGGLTAVGYVGIGLLAGWFCWQCSDLVRIITGDLHPRDGEYYSRFFQVRRVADASTR